MEIPRKEAGFFNFTFGSIGGKIGILSGLIKNIGIT
jgi:hypothetical protein